jgi:hypothetical protein
MKLTWRDAGATVLMDAGLFLAWTVVQGWGWPFLDNPREGIVALAVLGHGPLIGASIDDNRWTRSSAPFLVVRALFAIVSVICAIAGLVTGAYEYLVLFMIATVAMWFVIMARHAVTGSMLNSRPGVTPGA